MTDRPPSRHFLAKLDAMADHTHPDTGVLTAACPACIARVADDQRAALIAEAPLRRCTWNCAYSLPGDDEEDDCCRPVRTLSFQFVARVPAGWTGWDVDDEYAGRTGEAFALALPDTVPPEWTDYACIHMDVLGVAIGSIVPDLDAAPPVDDHPSLF
jgi:hypothetical protein